MDRRANGLAMAGRPVARTMAVVLAVASGTALAAPLIDRGTWYGTDGTDGTLRGRDALGAPVSMLVSGAVNPTMKYVYDTVLNLTWLADWNAGAGTSFDNSGPLGSSKVDGRMTWTNANAWAASLTEDGGGWVLPTVLDTDAPGCQLYNTGTDCGYNVYGSEVERRDSPLAHMYYDTLGNLPNPLGVDMPHPIVGLKNTGPFSNMQRDGYWSGTALATYPASGAWLFWMFFGGQDHNGQNLDVFAVAVRPGDVLAGSVPEPGGLALLGLAIGTAALARRLRQTA